MLYCDMNNAFDNHTEKEPIIEKFSSYSEVPVKSIQKAPQKVSKYMHKYYVKLFMQTLLKDRKNIENGSYMSDCESDDNEMYDHIKGCKICKNMIREKNKKEDVIEPFSILDKPEYKKIIVIILIGLILIIVIDLFVRIGRKSSTFG